MTSFASDMLALSPELCSSDRQHYRASIRHIEKGGIGYNHGYTTFDGFFAPNPKSWLVMPFLDLRAHIFDTGKVATNIGVGVRRIAGSRAYGVNAYYDYRNTKTNNYNQVGVGFESLGRRLDFRINGYRPVGKNLTTPYQAEFDRFVGHEMIVSQKYRFAMKGANAELGCHFGKSRCFDFYAAAGAYVFTGDVGPRIWGGKARLVGKYKEYVTLELSNSYDKMFRNRFQCELTLTLPFGGGSQAKNVEISDCCDALLSRMVQSVVRQEIIVLGCSTECGPAIDPATGKPFYFVFVDNTSSSKGTYESPYPTLTLAENNSKAGDVIYVFPGNGTTLGMDAGITLKRNQKFWGAGTKHTLTTSQGNVVIPAQSSSSPQMTNTDGDGITLSSNNEVSGFILTDVIGRGIIGTDSTSIDISDCTLDSSLDDQIHLEYSGASGVANLNNLTITHGGSDAIFIDSSASSMTCTVSNSTIQNNTVYAIEASFAHKATVNLTNNTFEHNENGGNIAFGGPSTMLVADNIFNNTLSVSAFPLLVRAGESPVSVTIENNSIQDNTCGAIQFVLNDTESTRLTINNNTIANNTSGALGVLGAPILITLNGTTDGNCYLNLIGNTLSNNEGRALYCVNGSFNDFQVNVAGNTATHNGGGLTFANGSNTFTLDVRNNTISNGQDHGITTSGDITIGTATMTIAHNQITENSNSASGIALSHSGTNLNFVVTDNDLSANDTSGIILYSATGIENVAVKIENNTINENQNAGFNAAGGIDLEQFTNLSGTIKNNTLTNNVSSGVFVGTTQPSSSVCLTMSGNDSNTGYTLSNDTGTFNLAPCNVDSVNSGTITTVGTITPVQSCLDAAPCP